MKMAKKKEYSKSDIAEMYAEGLIERINFDHRVYGEKLVDHPWLMARNDKRMNMTADEYAEEPFDRSILWENTLTTA